jgi:TolB-like protein
MIRRVAADDIAFGEFRLSASTRELYRNGERVALKGRAVDILFALAAANGELVTKDALMERVWSGRVVEDNNIQVHVSALRKALRNSETGETLIVTEQGRGYRLIGIERPGGSGTSAVSGPLPPDKPSIAILPFQNMTGDPEQDYFADGIAEEITTSLSRFRSLFVIARNSSFTYKGRAIDVKQVGLELGVRYLLEGSVRKSARQVRITCQLIDAATVSHLWADRFDGLLDDIFELQDQLTARVVGALAPRLQEAEIKRARRKPTENLDAYDCYLRALASTHQSKDRLDEALSLTERASELDPHFAAPHGLAAFCYVHRNANGWMIDRAQEAAEAARRARRAAELDNEDAVALAFAAYALSNLAHEVDEAMVLADRALVLNGNLAFAWLASGFVRCYREGEHETAIEHVARAMRLSPVDSHMYAMQAVMALAHYVAGKHDEAVTWAERALAAYPIAATMRIAAASHVFAGRLEEARKMIARARDLDPGTRLSDVKDRTGPRSATYLARYLGALRKAGLPE